MEAVHSSSRRVTARNNQQKGEKALNKFMYFGATVLRTSIKKVKNTTISDYTQIKSMVVGFESGKFTRPNLETLV